MALEVFNLLAAAHIDNGRLNVAIEQELKRCTDDCIDRPMVRAARTITLQFVITPCEDGDTVDVDFRIHGKLPKRQSRSFNMQPAQGGLLFNELSPEAVKQATLDMAQKNAPKVVQGAKSNAG